MREEEMLDKIRDASKEVRIPEELEPQEIKRKLKRSSRNLAKKISILGTAAAAVLLVCCIGGVSKMNFPETGVSEKSPDDALSGGMETGGKTAAAEKNTEKAAEDSIELAGALEPKKDAGDLYQVAKDYSQVYETLEHAAAYSEADMGVGITEDVSGSYKAQNNTDRDGATGGFYETKEELADVAGSAAQKQNGGYSKTNVQTEGVDESDIVKTDGNYIYTVSDREVTITDIREQNMKVAGRITVESDTTDVFVKEMYVDGDQLNLVVQKEETSLQEDDFQLYTPNPKYGTEEDAAISEGTEPRFYAEPMYGGEAYQMVYKVVTELRTYDISDRKNPRLAGTVSQDGSYRDSRKIGDIVYLFTENYMEPSGIESETVITDEQAGGFIPLVNGKMISPDRIYLPKQGNSGFVISSTNTKKPDQVIDHVMILNDYAEIYVSKTGIYLYHTDYSEERSKTRIARFSLKNGEINGVNAATVTGEVYDTFAVSEEKGHLRILTTDWSGSEDSNQLYILDENMNITGQLEGIARGERIYAARYLGDIVYFVTYRNTDPLFAVDISDPANPKILSEVKLSGFSEYLHFWGQDKLVGIGYETDENTGVQEGLKLVLFNIENPEKIKIEKEFVIKNSDYSPGLYNYKSVLADPEENLLGFGIASCQDGKDKNSYLLFSVEKGSFQNLLTVSVEEDGALENYRGVYAGDTFYLVSAKSIISFDRKQNYQKQQTLDL